MDEIAKKAVKKTILRLRNLLEKEDIPAILKQHGIFPDGRRVPAEKITLLDAAGRSRRERLEEILEREIKATGNDPKAGVARYCREVAFTYLNRLIALRCMEVRGLIDECIKTRPDYAGRSLRHNRSRREYPEKRFDEEDTDGLKAFLCLVFRELHDDIRILFDPDDEYSIIMPSLKALRECIRSLNEDIPEEAFKEPELIGWVYQYFQTEEKNRVFEEVRTKKKKIQGDDIVSATSLYTERYMVDYLVQNSLSAIWMEMYPDSRLCEKWPYFVKDQDLKPREPRAVKSLTFLDPACGSGHFLLITFDLFVQMYEEEARLADEGRIPRDWVVPEEKIAKTIIESNLHGIDIDLRSVQLTWLVLYLKMREHQNSIGAPKELPEKVNLVAADASLLDTPEFSTWCEHRFKEEPYSLNIIKGIAGRLRNLSEIGSLARPEEDLRELIHKEKQRLLSAWEKGKGQNELFAEFLLPEQRELPFEKVTDDQFWDGLIRRFSRTLNVFLKRVQEEARERLFTTELQRVIVFLDLCRKRYDIVATNPPYMGSKNMGKELNDYVQRVYPEGKRDLYAAFIQRNREWVEERGIVAMVTQQSWMFLKSYVKMREEILQQNCIQTLAHLGPHAFAEISGEVVNAILFTLTNEKPAEEHRFIAFRLIAPDNPKDKDKIIQKLIHSDELSLKYKPLQLDFLHIPYSPLPYWLEKELIKLYDSTMSEITESRAGLTTGNSIRYFRWFWEIQDFTYWRKLANGGGFRKWAGYEQQFIRWDPKTLEILSRIGNMLPSREYYFQPGFSLTQLHRGSLNCRVMEDCAFTNSSVAIFPIKLEWRHFISAMLNSRLSSYLLRATTSKMAFEAGHIRCLPMPKETNVVAKIWEAVNWIERLKQESLSQDITECAFKETNLYFLNNQIIRVWESEVILLTLEAVVEKQLFESYKVSLNSSQTILNETGTPAGWHPLIQGDDEIPKTDICEIPKEVIEYLNNHKLINPSQEELSKIKSRLRVLYEAGPGAKLEDVIEEKNTKSRDNEGESEVMIGKRIPIPTETFLEELSVKMEIHPISIYWLLKEMQKKEGVVCWSEFKRYVEDYFTVMILRMLGFRWPKQVEAEEPVPEWADKDGIIPITDYTGEKTLFERIRDRIGAEFGEDKISAIETEFSDILYNAACKDAEIKSKKPPGKKITLADWLEREFFKRHTSQFKKRPIAWHLTSSNGTFQILLFYHKISGDILKNLKNIYLAKVQSYYNILLERARVGESIPGNLTLGKLQDIEDELEDFASKLDTVINLPYEPLIDDGVRVNIAPLQKVGLLKHPVLAEKDVDRAITDRNRWREDDNEQYTIWRL